MTRTVAVDFDGVIHAYSKGWHDGTIYDPPVDGAFEALTGLQEFFAVFIHTTRPAPAVAEWLLRRSDGLFECVTEHPREEVHWSLSGWPDGREFHLVSESTPIRQPRTFWDDQTKIFVTNRKLPAVAYIDDRGIRFTNWRQALADLAAVV